MNPLKAFSHYSTEETLTAILQIITLQPLHNKEQNLRLISTYNLKLNLHNLPINTQTQLQKTY